MDAKAVKAVVAAVLPPHASVNVVPLADIAGRILSDGVDVLLWFPAKTRSDKAVATRQGVAQALKAAYPDAVLYKIKHTSLGGKPNGLWYSHDGDSLVVGIKVRLNGLPGKHWNAPLAPFTA